MLTQAWHAFQNQQPYNPEILQGIPVTLTAYNPDTNKLWTKKVLARYSKTTLDLNTIPAWKLGGPAIAGAVKLQGYPQAVWPRCAVYIKVLQIDWSRI